MVADELGADDLIGPEKIGQGMLQAWTSRVKGKSRKTVIPNRRPTTLSSEAK